jgi:hypothetical protein
MDGGGDQETRLDDGHVGGSPAAGNQPLTIDFVVLPTS